MSDREVELERQQALVGALWRDPAAEATCVRRFAAVGRVPAARALQAYRANAAAATVRALAATFPVVQSLIGGEAFEGLAGAYWRATPPERGDLASLAEGLPGFVAGDAQLADVPYLADVARFEATLARCESAADARGSAGEALASLGLLAQRDPSTLALDLAPGAAVVRSAWPVATIVRAHRAADAMAAMDRARERIAARRGEAVFVWRFGWAARFEIVDDATAGFLEAILAGRSLADAHACGLERAREWSFETWLARAIEARWHAGVRLR